MTDVGGEPRPFRLDRQDRGQGDAGDPGDGHGARAELCALGCEGGEHQQDRPQQTDRRPGAIEQKIGRRGAVGLGRQHLVAPKIAAEVKRFNDDQKLGYGSQATIDAGTQNLYATEYDMVYARSDYLNQWTGFISLTGLDPALDNISPRYVH